MRSSLTHLDVSRDLVRGGSPASGQARLESGESAERGRAARHEVPHSAHADWGLHAYTRACGWSLARAHAHSGDRLAIAAYLGSGPNFERAIACFSCAYADQNEHDHARLLDAIDSQEVPAEGGV